MTDAPAVRNSTLLKARQFVVLLHTIGSGFRRTDCDHFDWMFQVGESLRTWAVDKQALDPVAWIADSGNDCHVDVACQALPDHRLKYLNYEGPISGQRGEVKRVLSGTYQLVVDNVDAFEVTLTIGETASMGIATCEPRTIRARLYRNVVSDAIELGSRNWRLELFNG